VSARAAALMVLALLAGAACTTSGGAPMDDVETARAALLQRPTLESEVDRLTEVRDGVRAALAAGSACRTGATSTTD
jgi:hypothetical protein